MPSTFANDYDTERDSIGLTPSAVPADAVMTPPTTPWSVIEAASNQISAGQPVTVLPRQSWSIAEGQAFAERLNEFDRQAKAARVAAEQAAMDARMLDQMSRVAKSTKDIEVARRSIDMMALQRELQNTPAAQHYQVLMRHPLALGSQYGSALHYTTPEPQPFTPQEVTLPSGARGIRAGRYGEQFHYAPSAESDIGRARVGTEMTTPSGLHAVWVGPNQIRLVEKTGEMKDFTPGQLLDYAGTLKFSKDKTDQAKAKAIYDFIGQRVEKQIAPPTVAKPVAVLGQGTREDPARPKDAIEFGSVPSKAYYIDPGDGKLYRKK